MTTTTSTTTSTAPGAGTSAPEGCEHSPRGTTSSARDATAGAARAGTLVPVGVAPGTAGATRAGLGGMPPVPDPPEPEAASGTSGWPVGRPVVTYAGVVVGLEAARERRSSRALLRRRVETVREQLRTRAEAGLATAEYAIATIAAAGFAGLLIVILKSGAVKSMLTDIIHSALSVG